MYRCNLHFVAPEQLQIPDHVASFLRSKAVTFSKHSKLEEVMGMADVVYMTRIQKERFPDENEYNKVKGLYRINREMLSKAKPNMRLMHPLPRVDEIASDADEDMRAYYFKEAGNGVPVRAALLALVMGVVQ
jgi:aspartate carbamoyltransferase catalytic subunit